MTDNTTHTHKLYIGGIGWSGTKSHIIAVDELNDGSGYQGRPRSLCSDAFRWDGSQQPNNIKKVAPTTDNVNCKKCLIIVKRIAERSKKVEA